MTMQTGGRRFLINWSDAHGDLKRLVENEEPCYGEMETRRGWSYVTFFPREIEANQILYDVDLLLEIARVNSYYLPRDVVVQHNKVVVVAYPNEESPLSSLIALYHMMSSYADRFCDEWKYPSHGFYGKFGGIYERPEKGRVLAMYSQSDDALLHIHASLEELISEASSTGVRFELRIANGLSAIPRMLLGFDDPDYRRSGAGHYKITDPDLFAILLNQARHDYERYPFAETEGCIEIAKKRQ